MSARKSASGNSLAKMACSLKFCQPSRFWHKKVFSPFLEHEYTKFNI